MMDVIKVVVARPETGPVEVYSCAVPAFGPSPTEDEKAQSITEALEAKGFTCETVEVKPWK
jgi:hypothetical protein